MSSTQGSIETQEAIGHFTDALRQRIGTDRFRLWFTHGIRFGIESTDQGNVLVIEASSPFAADRIAKNFSTELRATAIGSLGDLARFRLEVAKATAQPDLLGGLDELDGLERDDDASADDVQDDADYSDRNSEHGGGGHVRGHAGEHEHGRASGGKSQGRSNLSSDASQFVRGRSTKRNADKLSSLLSQSTLARDQSKTSTRSSGNPNGGRSSREGSRNASGDDSAPLPPLPESFPTAGRTLESFLTGPCNDFAFSAATMAISTPEVATPLFLHGPTGTGKSHLLHAIAEEFRRRRRMRRVVLLTAEQFTNDFIGSVNTTGLPAFRRRYREVDALLIDDVHFLAAKTATLREALYTVESLTAAGKPLVFTANLPPADIRGLTGEVAGRMASGLVCPLTALDPSTRLQLLKRLVKTRCVLDCEDELLQEVSEAVGGDARAVTGVANLIGMLQRMFRREPTIDEVRRYGGDLLRNTRSAPSLRSIERAVCEAFGLEGDGLRGKAQTKRVSEPRTLAMYLARQHTGSAFTEIAQHFGRRSHSGAIAAQQKVETWLHSGKPIGGGDAAMSAKEAIARVEARLRVG